MMTSQFDLRFLEPTIYTREKRYKLKLNHYKIIAFWAFILNNKIKIQKMME